MITGNNEIPKIKYVEGGYIDMAVSIKPSPIIKGITKIVISEETGEIIAYYTLKCDSMKIEDSEMNPEPRQFPCIEVSRIVSAHTRAFFFSTYNNTRHYGRVCVDHETKKFTVLRQLNTMMYTHNERDPEVFKMIFEAVLAKLRKHHDISSYLVTGVLLKY